LLVVNGDLAVTGGFTFVGLVVVRGRLQTEGIGNRFAGGVVIASAGPGPSHLSGTTEVRYSSCGLDKALAGSAQPELLRERSWFQAH
jgi:hypothetical protein